MRQPIVFELRRSPGLKPCSTSHARTACSSPGTRPSSAMDGEAGGTEEEDKEEEEEEADDDDDDDDDGDPEAEERGEEIEAICLLRKKLN